MTTIPREPGRFMVVEGNNLPSPGKCWCCGAMDRDCIHWGYDEDFVGVVMLCENCVLEAASHFRVDEQAAKIEALENHIKALVQTLEETRVCLVANVDGLVAAVGNSAKFSDLVVGQGAIAGGARKG